jgi:hypothetical protein
MARRHNDANVLSMGARVVAPELAEEITRIFLDTPFEGGRHQRRLDEIAEIEQQECDTEESRDAPAVRPLRPANPTMETEESRDAPAVRPLRPANPAMETEESRGAPAVRPLRPANPTVGETK